ncbi:MAG: hypothetical protein Q4D78_00225 [Neisseria zoodegmatis]|uniref:hypothetical protein n=1 Tax=Neisseria zoodegmatis TaxID=326523 RepID=UPI0026ECDB80|nr:hypothetical protein [Neisseria zoodegmatis]MDO5068620.1 hypothetical protein [Neisseria zoodegmatis]
MTDTPSDAAVFPPKPRSRTLKDSLKWYKTTFKLLFKYWYLWLAVILISIVSDVLFDLFSIWSQKILETYLPSSPVHDALPFIETFIFITCGLCLTSAFLVTLDSVVGNKPVISKSNWKKWCGSLVNMAKLAGFASLLTSAAILASVVLTAIWSEIQTPPEHDFFYPTLLMTIPFLVLLIPFNLIVPLLVLQKRSFKQACVSGFTAAKQNILPLLVYFLPAILLILIENQMASPIFYYLFSFNINHYIEAIETFSFLLGSVLMTLQLYIPYRDIYISPASENQLKQ